MNSNQVPTDTDIDRALRVCEMYHIAGKTQQQISREIGVSRSQVSRILTFAKNAGLVSITIKDPRSVLKKLGENLIDKYGLRDARVVSTVADLDILKQRIGYAAAQLLENLVDTGSQVFGIGRGSTVHETIQALPTSSKSRLLTVVPMVGGAGLYNPAFQVSEMVKTTAQRMGGDYVYLHAPYFVTTPEIKKAFLQDDNIAECIKYWSMMDIALVGIGRIRFNDPLFSARIKNSQLRTGRRIVADICGRFIDEDGNIVPEEPDVLMSIDLNELRQTKTIVAVAGGKGKETAIKAAVSGGWVDVLITDEWIAQKLCDRN